MRKIVLSIIFIFILKPATATVQIPDLLLIGKDTFLLRTFLLENLSMEHRPFGLTSSTAPHTACWRGYQAIWRLENDSLYLEKILYCTWNEPAKEENLVLFFQKNKLKQFIRNERIVAEWCNLSLTKMSMERKESKYGFLNGLMKDKDKNEMVLKLENGALVYKNWKLLPDE